jgi:hypothetical protein
MEELLRRWHTGEMTSEQAIGQILLLLKELDTRVGNLEKEDTSEPASK